MYAWKYGEGNKLGRKEPCSSLIQVTCFAAEWKKKGEREPLGFRGGLLNARCRSPK